MATLKKIPSNKFLFLLVLSFFILSKSYSQKYNFKNFTVENGLPQSYVQTIIQDNQGYIWIGTVDGLIKLTGTDIKTYTKRDGLSENWISCGYKDKDGHLWFGHQGGLVSVYNTKSKRFETFVTLTSTISKSRIHSIYQDKPGNIMFCTLGSGLMVFNGTSIKNYNSKNSIVPDEVYAVVEDREGKIWMGTGNGLYILEKGKIIKTSVSGDVVYCLTIDDGGNIWAGVGDKGAISFLHNDITHQGDSCIIKNIQKYDVDNGLADNTVFSIFKDSKNNIWFGSYGKGISMYKRNKNKAREYFKTYSTINGLIHDVVYNITEDRESNIWIGTLGGASQFRYNDERFEFYTKSNGLIDTKIWSVVEDNNGNIWTGSEGGVNKSEFDRHARINKFLPVPLNDNIKSPHVFKLYIDKENNLWCGGRGGRLSVLPKEGTKLLDQKLYTKLNLSNTSIFSITQDKNNNLWLATLEAGLIKYNPVSKEIKLYNVENQNFSNDVAYCVFTDSKGNIWAASEGGLSKLENEKFITYNKTNGLNHPVVYCITEDKNGAIWVGTKEGGVYKYEGKQFENYSTQNGLSSDNVYSIVCDNDNNIWMGTSSGIDKFDRKKNTFKHYGKAEGFLGVEANQNAVCKDRKGNLWFGTVNGLIKYSPENEISNPIEPLTHITGIKIFQKDTLPLTQTEISYKQNHLTFSFVGLSYSIPENVRYQYILQGFDRDWSPVSNKTEVTYSNIPPGEYTFSVKACNNDGVWNKEPAKFHFTVTPPFWKTTWFITLGIIVITASVFTFIKVRTKHLVKAKEKLEKTVKERTHEVVQQKEIIEQKNKDITDSINYAQRIQKAILPLKQDISKKFSDSFVFFRPRDIVSGDLYWYSDQGERALIASVDCTGHGVPGAFMSIVGNSSLNEVVNEKNIIHPDLILSALDEKVTNTLKQSEDSQSRDGMDVALVMVDFATNELHYAGANRPLYFIRNGQLTKTKGNTFPVGGFYNKKKVFTNHTFKIEKGDTIYIFSDGYADQFGGPNGKKFMSKQFDNLLVSIQSLPLQAHEKIIKDALLNWQGNHESVDDVLVIGLRF